MQGNSSISVSSQLENAQIKCWSSDDFGKLANGLQVEFDESGKAYGVTSEGETAKCKKVVCDPSYLPEKVDMVSLWERKDIHVLHKFSVSKMLLKNEQVKKVGRVARAICIMKHPIPDTKDSHSVQIILPKKQLKRKSDM